MKKTIFWSTNFLRWVGGVFFLLSAIVYFPTSPLAGLLGLLVTALLVPPIEKRISKYLLSLKKPIALSTKAKVITGVVLSFAFMGNVPSSPISTPPVEKTEVTPTTTISVSPAVQAETRPEVTPTTEVSSTKTEAKMVKVVDGDTIDVEINGKTERIRIIGIDTPEVVDPRKPVECFGKEASDFAKEVMGNNKTVLLEADPTQGERDKYSRLLRYVWVADGREDFGKAMIEYGYAHEYTYNTPYKYRDIYKQAQRTAEENKEGLWADDACPVATPTPTKTTNNAPTNAPATSGGSCKYSCSSPDRDCSDFSSHSEAQTFFNCCGFTATNDPMKLDGVKVDDGIACESI